MNSTIMSTEVQRRERMVEVEQQVRVDFENLNDDIRELIGIATIRNMIELLPYEEAKPRNTEEIRQFHTRRFMDGWRRLEKAGLGVLPGDEAAQYLVEFGIAPEQETARTILDNTDS